MTYTINLYEKTIEYLKAAMSDLVPCQDLELIVVPMLDILPPEHITIELLNIVVRETSDANANTYYPIAYLILDKYSHFYSDKKLHLADFAWELSARIGNNDGTKELFYKVLSLVPEHVDYDPLNNNLDRTHTLVNASLATQVLHNSRNRSENLKILISLNADLIGSRGGVPSVIEEFFSDTEKNIKELEVTQEFKEMIIFLYSQEKIATHACEVLDKYPLTKQIVNSIYLNEKLDNTMTGKTISKSKKI